MKEDPRKRGAARIPSRGPELLGGVLFLVGCLPAVALIKALRDGTDLSSAGLGGTAALAAQVATWVGTWPGLLISGAIAAFGAMAVLGALRSELLRRMVGIVVCGLGVAAISSALAAGSGGRIGDGTGARLADAVGPWAGILVGLGIVAVALWLAFAEAPRTGSRTLEVSLDGPELRRASAERPGPAVQEISSPKRKRKVKKPAVPKASVQEPPAGNSSAGVSSGQEPSAPEDVSKEASSGGVSLSPADSSVATQDSDSAGAGMPPLDHEPDPVVDGPSRSADAGGLSLAAIPGWIGGLVGALRARLLSKRPRVAMPTPKKSEPKVLGEALVQGETEGVSHDEAAALAPDGNTLAYMEEVWRNASASLPQVEPIPSSPYPEDPRLKGEIPQGTTPLGGAVAARPVPSDAEVPASAPAAMQQEAAPFDDVAPFDLVDDEESVAMDADGGHVGPEALTKDLPRGVAPLEAEEAQIPLPRPPASWESGFEEETIPEVDGAWTRAGADETPEEDLTGSSVEIAAQDAAESFAEDTAESSVGPDADREHGLEASAEVPTTVEEALTQAADSPEATDAAGELEEADNTPGPDLSTWEREAEPEDLSEDSPEEEASDGEELAEEDSEEDSEEESAEYEYVDEDGNPIDIESLEDGEYEVVDEDDYEAAELEEDEDEAAELDEDEDAELEEEDDEDDEDDEEGDEDEGSEYEEVSDEEGLVEDETEQGLEEAAANAEVDEGDPALEVDDEDEYEEASEEESVVLEPQSPPSGTSSDSERLLKAGRVLVRQGRVAVSVLQQELDMEFDEACQLLDQLQAEGLIGPYKGGKKRDILLSEEEWENHFAHS
ncbi:hypothetical protein N9Z54_07305 [Planctomycetota bacterium]|nr:hypothetical protein [Planctomycetota bacterium]